MKYQEPNIEIIYIVEDLVRTSSVTEGSGLPTGDIQKW